MMGHGQSMVVHCDYHETTMDEEQYVAKISQTMCVVEKHAHPARNTHTQQETHTPDKNHAHPTRNKTGVTSRGAYSIFTTGFRPLCTSLKNSRKKQMLAQRHKYFHGGAYRETKKKPKCVRLQRNRGRYNSR